MRTEVDSTLPATATKREWVEKRKMKDALVQMDESKEIEGRSLRFETTVRELERTLLVRTNGNESCEMREREMCMLHDEDTRTRERFEKRSQS